MEDPAEFQIAKYGPYVTCGTCGCRSTMAEQFRRRGNEYTCPGCLEEEAERKGRRNLWALAGLILYVLLIALVPTVQSPMLVALANFAWLVVALALLVPLHELGHIIALWLTGGRLWGVRWGFGGDLLKWRWHGVAFYVGRNVFGGFTLGGFLGQKALRLRFALLLCGGVAANLALAGLLWWQSDKQMRLLGDGIFWSEMLILASLIQATAAVLPMRASVGPVKMPTDGAWMLQLLSGRVGPDLIRQLYFVNGVNQASAFDDAVLMNELASQAMEHYPNERWAQEIAMLGRSMHSDGRESHAWYEEMLTTSTELTGMQRAVLLNNAAWSGLLVGGETQLAIALERARDAYHMMPWFAPIRGTYGSLLIEHGEVNAGVAHLHWARTHHQGARDKGLVTSYLALASALNSDYDRALALMYDAESLASGDPLIKRTRERIDTMIRNAPSM